MPSANDEMRELSGNVTDDRPLVALLYVLMRDHVTPGAMEEAFENHASKVIGKTQQYVNGWLARHAQDLARRLTGPDDICCMCGQPDASTIHRECM